MQINLDDGYSFGLGTFETIYVYKGKIIFLDEHLERLNSAIKKINLPVDFVKKEEVEKFVKENFSKEVDNEAFKILVSEKNKIFLKRDCNYNEETYKKGFNLNIAEAYRNEKSVFTYCKSLNCGDSILEKRRSKNLGFDEPLFLNSKKQITEGATSNIFFVKENKIYTPPLTCGLLNGTLRRYIISKFKNKYEIIEKEIYLEDLKDFDEVFITNSLFGVMPVNKIEIDKTENYSFKKREIANIIFEDYKNFLENL